MQSAKSSSQGSGAILATTKTWSVPPILVSGALGLQGRAPLDAHRREAQS